MWVSLVWSTRRNVNSGSPFFTVAKMFSTISKYFVAGNVDAILQGLRAAKSACSACTKGYQPDNEHELDMKINKDKLNMELRSCGTAIINPKTRSQSYPHADRSKH